MAAAPDSPQAVLALYEERINRHDFELLVPLIDAKAVFWFSDGSHIGIDAIRAAFERTWNAVADETYWLTDMHWIATGAGAAACLYRFHWRGLANARPISGHGRGTTVLRDTGTGWRIVHEHLSVEA